jgi:hypothetical protein
MTTGRPRCRGVRPEPPEHLQPVHVRHCQVQQDEVGVTVLDGGQGGLPVLGRQRLVPVQSQQAGHHVARDVEVVDDEDGRIGVGGDDGQVVNLH